MDEVDVVVIGAGVIGLACARALARAGLEVVLIEKAPRYGGGVSSRSSEVIHSGLYGAPGSLKAGLCLRGRALLIEFCERFGVAYRGCGKLVVATRLEDEARLAALQARGQENGVDDLVVLSRAQARLLEPELACTAALLSPGTGIVDSHALMTALLADAQAHGALLACHGGVQSAEPMTGGWQVRVSADYVLRTRWIVNAAGLDAQSVAASMVGFPPAAVPRRYLARGHYFSLSGRVPFGRLIYPVPVDGGLGIHLTLDLAGRARFGPDVEWLASEAAGADLDCRVNVGRQPWFEEEVRRYWPGLPAGAMAPDYSGIRPKLSGPGQPVADFHIAGPVQHGCSGVVQLFGIESPGLTASLAVAELVTGTVLGTESDKMPGLAAKAVS
ncbi:NAD(P)/FAD-dependent oxidoreductase [Nostoc sp. HG1]|nr:NAD(P)/FAD-dependent oxidoreductase [Nostoc sp. HG1]